MEEQLQQNDEVEIDLIEIFHILLKKIWIIVFCAILGAAVALGATKLLITPQYTATASIYIFSESTSITSVADIQIGDSLTQDFILLSKSRPVVERVIEQLDLNSDYDTVVGNISIENPEDSHFLRISVMNPDPKLAADIANAMADAVKEQVKEVMGKDSPSTVEDAIVPTVASSPNVMKNTMTGALIGFALSAAVIILLYILDDTLKSEEDVKRYLQSNTLAAIPIEKKKRWKRQSVA